MKECPFCTGSIPESAAKCKHCGEWVTTDPRPAPHATPATSQQPPTKDGVVLLGEAAKTGVAAYIVLSIVGIVFAIILIFVLFVPSWKKAEKQQDQMMNEWQKTRQQHEQRQKEFDAEWNRNRYPGKMP